MDNFSQNNSQPTGFENIPQDLFTKNPRLKNLLLILMAALLFSGIGLAVFSYQQSIYRQKLYYETEGGLPVHRVNKSEGWKAYKSQTFRFELKYPSNATVEQVDVGEHPYGVFEIKDQNSHGISSIAVVPENDEQINDEQKKYAESAVSEKNITLDGIIGKYYSVIDDSGNNGGAVFVRKNGFAYILLGIEPGFSEILSTFKFTK